MGQRTHFIDRLRVILTALVIAHHTAITYGGSGGWFYREVSDGSTASSLLLTLLCAVNQAFFMGMFFLLAGYFTPTSLARKGTRHFLHDRFLRLGVPLVVFGFVLGPLTDALAGVARGRPMLDAWLDALSQGQFVIGPLWFAFALLIFALGYVGWRMVRRGDDSSTKPIPGPARWLVAALAVGAAALLLRQFVPVGVNVLGLQLGYFASYVFLFALGCAAWPHRWLEQVERRHALPWAWVSLAALPLLFVAGAVAGGLSGRPVNFNGGWSLPAVVYAFWEPLIAWGVIAMLLWQFRVRFNHPSERWQGWADRAYGAFIVHAPVIVALSIALREWGAPPLLKFVVVATGGTVLSFMVAGALRRIPGARRVI